LDDRLAAYKSIKAKFIYLLQNVEVLKGADIYTGAKRKEHSPALNTSSPEEMAQFAKYIGSSTHSTQECIKVR
jgi:hypothetical protein